MDNSFLSSVMERHGDAVYKLALYRLQNLEDAEDVYQDTFLRLLQEPRAPEWEDEHLKAWLLKVTINRCIDMHRYQIVHSTVSLEDVPEIAAEDVEQYSDVWDIVSHLPERQKTVFHLHYAEGYKTDEIAAILRMLPSTVRVTLNRARKALRKELRDNGRVCKI